MYQNIRALREDHDFSQTKIAELLKVSQTTYSRYENGVLDIPTDVLITLSRFYGVTVDFLLGQVNQ